MLSISQYIEILGNPNPTKVIAQRDCPVEITKYQAIYIPDLESDPEGILHSIAYTNVSDAKVLAIKFGIAAFDIFNGMLDKFSGFAIEELDVARSATNEWRQSSCSPWMFKTLGTGVVYLDAVRFENNQFLVRGLRGGSEGNAANRRRPD